MAEEKNNKRLKRVIVPVLIVLGALIILAGGFGIWVYASLHSMKDTGIPEVIEEPMPEPEPEEEIDIESLEEAKPTPEPMPTPIPDSEREIYNFVLFGLDTRSPKNLSSGNTDVMLIVTLDKEHGKLKITSLMRDMLVENDYTKHPFGKLNSVFAHGGAAGAVETIEKVTGIPIHGYAIMNFHTVAKTIDALGGVSIKLSESEVFAINRMLVGKFGDESRNIKKAGTQKLNGEKAVMYMRIRRVGNSDFGRTQRQRIVLREVFEKCQDMSVFEMISLIDVFSNFLRTDLEVGQITDYVRILYSLRNAEFYELRMPADDTFRFARYKGGSVIEFDLLANSDLLKAFIYDDIIPEQKKDNMSGEFQFPTSEEDEDELMPPTEPVPEPAPQEPAPPPDPEMPPQAVNGENAA